jgi:hypothetical protein
MERIQSPTVKIFLELYARLRLRPRVLPAGLLASYYSFDTGAELHLFSPPVRLISMCKVTLCSSISFGRMPFRTPGSMDLQAGIFTG